MVDDDLMLVLLKNQLAIMYRMLNECPPGTDREDLLKRISATVELIGKREEMPVALPYPIGVDEPPF